MRRTIAVRRIQSVEKSLFATQCRRIKFQKVAEFYATIIRLLKHYVEVCVKPRLRMQTRAVSVRYAE